MSSTSENMCGYGGLTMLFVGVIYIIASVIGIDNVYFYLVLLIISLVASIAFLLGLIGTKIEERKDKDQHRKNIAAFQNIYDSSINKLGVVKSDIKATLIDVNEYDTKVLIQQYLWVKNETLHIFPTSKYYEEHETSSTNIPTMSKLKLRSIPIASISYYEEVGELIERQVVYQEEVRVYNEAAGRRIPQMQIRTKDIVEDNRKVELVYENSNNEVEVLAFKHDAYDVFKKLIPSKDLVMIERKRRVDSIREDNK